MWTAPPTNRGLNSMVLPAGFLPRPETPVFLCCRRIGPPPQFEPSNDRRMEWSPSPVAHSSEWAAEWLCVGCSRTVDLSDAPCSVSPPCPQCSNVPTMVVDVPGSQHWFWCPSCQRRLEPCVVEPPIPQSESVALPATPRDWFTQGPSNRMGRLNGWGDPPITAPGNGTQSWLPCPLISLALAGAERAHGVPLYSTRPRQPVPPDQERFWLSTAQDIIDSLIAHFRAMSLQSTVALELQRPESWAGGDHLSPGLQERCVPRHVFEALNVWLTDQCASSDVRTSPPVEPSPFIRNAPDPPVPRSPFGLLVQPDQVPNVVPAGGNLPASSPVVASHPFVGVPTQGGQSPATVQFAEGGPVRLTRFVEMSLDSYNAQV